jgi:hypothetical protein
MLTPSYQQPFAYHQPMRSLAYAQFEFRGKVESEDTPRIQARHVPPV